MVRWRLGYSAYSAARASADSTCGNRPLAGADLRTALASCGASLATE